MITMGLSYGVQSFTLAAMVALGELPPVDIAIFVDTALEHKHTYLFMQKWEPWLIDHGLEMRHTCGPAAYDAILTKEGQSHVPAYTLNLETGKKGRLRRSCTERIKISSARRVVRQELERRGLKKEPGIVEHWLGISTDEVNRFGESDVQYITNRYPLLEMGMSRYDCIAWLRKHNLEVPLPSHCVICPGQSRAAWWQTMNGHPWDRRIPLMIDEIMRHKRPGFLTYLHESRKPLAEIDFSQPELIPTCKPDLSWWAMQGVD